MANVTSSSSTLPSFLATMQAAAANPAGYNLSYNYYIDTSTFSASTYLQFGFFVNTGSGYYAQNYGSPNELQLSGTQTGSGQIFQGTVTANLATLGFSMPPADTFFRLGLVENGNGTGVGVYVSNISLSPVSVPEPATLALAGIGMVGLVMFRRRNA